MPSPPQRILVRSVNWLGDAVMTTPALQRLREARPDAHITLLAPAKLADIWQNHPAINALQTFTNEDGPVSIGRRLRAENFDVGLVLPNSPRSALELWLARIPERIGYARPWRNWFLTQAVAARPGAMAMHKRSPAEINRLIQPGAATPETKLSRYRPSYLSIPAPRRRPGRKTRTAAAKTCRRSGSGCAIRSKIQIELRFSRIFAHIRPPRRRRIRPGQTLAGATLH